MFLHDADQNITYKFSDDTLCDSLYRPFFKQQFVYEKQFIQKTYQQLKFFRHLNIKTYLFVLRVQVTLVFQDL